MKKAWIIITAWIIVAAIVVLLCRRIPATVPYSELEGIEFWNAGTGNWQAYVNVMSDGTFTAGGHDLDMGINGEGYPGGTMWMTEGGGTLSDLKKTDFYAMYIVTEDDDYQMGYVGYE